MMQYLVLETHPAYAVLLDEEGRFLKAANLHYTVGDRVTEIVELQPVPNGNAGRWKKSLASLSALAACLCLVFFGYYQPNFSPYGTLRLQINPDVTLTLSENDRVVGLAGGNQDGWDLIEGYDYHGKDRDTATDELVDQFRYISGRDAVVDQVCAGLEVLAVHQMGRHKTAAVRGSAAQLRAARDRGADVDISPMNLQNVFVALCGHGDAQ